MDVSLLYYIFVSSIGVQLAASLSCMDDKGSPCDWFIIYKLPKFVENHSSPSGLAYMFVTDKAQEQWTSSDNINDTQNNPLYNTLKQVYANDSGDILKIFYNDEHPDGKISKSLGHTKGIVSFSKSRGIWIVHSVPKFPTDDPSYIYPESGTKYGQSFLCVTYDVDQLDTIALQLRYNNPFMYATNDIPESYTKSRPNLESLKNKKKGYGKNSVDLISAGRNKFTSYAKDRKFGRDLYDGWLAESLESSLYTETWQNGRGDFPSNCSGKYKVWNIQNLAFADHIQFKDTRDHSKWAVSDSPDWICIGDINRQKGQDRRSGGTVCMKNIYIWKIYHKAIQNVEKCP